MFIESRLFGTTSLNTFRISLLVLGVGCQGALALGDYSFGGSAGASGAGVGGDGSSGAGAGGNTGGDSNGVGGNDIGGRGGTSAGSGGDTGGSGNPGGNAGTGSDPGDAGPLGECAESQRCVPPIPVGWQGPIVLGAAGSACASPYPTALGELRTDFEAGATNCGCTCIVTGVQCRLRSSNGDIFIPDGSCDSPPIEDDCISAASVTTCGVSSTTDDITPSTFQTTLRSCGGAAASAACGSGTCYPSSDDAKSLCISAIGGLACPSGFPQQTIYYQNITDNRTCGECNCFPQGQVCQVDVEICSVGFSYETLTEGDECRQLSSGDGDGVTQMSFNVQQQGTCTFAGRGVDGATVPADPITVCCME
ncbi:MAG TPA: hypothetical protein VMG12_12145 [Polyangiaceae bacterium]|nr:hypothetical protein [Polyangiaceae bacterium]